MKLYRLHDEGLCLTLRITMTKLWSCCEKLSREIEWIEKKLEDGEWPSSIVLKPSLQADIFCICALLRPVLEVLPTCKGYSIDVHEVGRNGQEKIDLKTLAERVTHYVYYTPGYLGEEEILKTQSVRIMSDWDAKKDGLYAREFRLPDLIDVAKKVVNQGRLIVSEYKKKHKRKRIENLLANRKQIEEILSRQTPKKSKAQIGKRRFEVLMKRTQGLTSSEIADQLEVSESTIRRDRVVIRESETQINRVLYQLQ